MDMPVTERLGLHIKRVEQELMAAKHAALRPLGLTVPQYVALYALHDQPGLSAAALARACLVTPQTIATVLANLEAKGLIGREPSELHGKVLVTRLTELGRARLTEADARAVGVESALWSAFDDTEREQFRAFLHRATAALGA